MVDEQDVSAQPKTRRRGLRIWLIMAVILGVAVGLGVANHYKRRHTQEKRVYAVADALPPGPIFKTLAGLAKELEDKVQPGIWKSQGGASSIEPFFLNTSLIVDANLAAHDEIKDLLDARRKPPTSVTSQPLAQPVPIGGPTEPGVYSLSLQPGDTPGRMRVMSIQAIQGPADANGRDTASGDAATP